jgi:hypothetical protein
VADQIVAIVGSADATRSDYRPALSNAGEASKAAEALGRELAKAGYRVMVYSAESGFIEAAVVKGYVASGAAKADSILYYPPARHDGQVLEFPEQQANPHLFHTERATDPDWEIPFYRSLHDADSVVLLGGGRSVLITGIVAVSERKPTLAIATFGGSAQRVWELMSSGAASPPEKAELNAMGVHRWTDGTAAVLVKVLDAQRCRRRREEASKRASEASERRQELGGLVVAALSMVAAVALTGVAVFGTARAPWLFATCFLGVPLLAGLAGGLVRAHRGRAASLEPGTAARSLTVGAVLGMMAGLVGALLFVLAQLASNPTLKDFAHGVPEGLPLLVPFALMVAFVGGLTLEAVFGKLEKADVANVGAIEVKR